MNLAPRGGAILSQYEVARELGISRTRVAQLERSGMAKLRAGLRDWAPERGSRG